jgi:hypothetical protein
MACLLAVDWGPFCCPGLVLQVVVLDKMDYCASLRNLASVIDKPNCKVRAEQRMKASIQYYCRDRGPTQQS